MVRHPKLVLLLAALVMTASALPASAGEVKPVDPKSYQLSSGKAITSPKFDPNAEKIGLFDGLEDGRLAAVLIPQSAAKGNLLVENKTDKPLTIQVPDAFVAQQILPQFGGGGGGFGGGGGGGGLGGGGGGGQGLGGGLGGGGLGGGGLGGAGGGGGGFFSIPAGKKVSLKANTVCMNHGLDEPTSRYRYRIMRAESQISDEKLLQLLKMVGSGSLDTQSAQAAAWHLTDKMSFDQLAAKSVKRIIGPPSSYFTAEQLARAQEILAVATEKAAEAAAKKNEKGEQPAPVRTGRVES